MKFIFLITFPFLGSAFNMKSYPKINQLWKNKKILPMWFPIGQKHDISEPKLINIFDEPFTAYKDGEKRIQVIYDKCPHQGASLSQGHITNNYTLFCPYHGFEFLNGSFVRMPTKKYFKPTICVPKLHVFTDKYFAYVLPLYSFHETQNISFVEEPYQSPESMNKSFRCITGHKLINQYSDIITENVLDMLHISFVHSFGNRVSPIPFNISYKQLSNTSGRTIFQYYAGTNSISKQVGKNVVVVENEFYLPSTTVTRVIAGDFIKTVVTRTLHLTDKSSILFWELHRNFWKEPFETLVDSFLRFMMEKTLLEDINIIQPIEHNRRFFGINTTFDITINKFREYKNKLLESYSEENII